MATKKRILFVDDEPMVLQGLQRMLRPMRKEWDMDFAQGGESALQQIEKSHFDVVVSDMRMPGMSGAAFLKKVMEQSPTTVRLLLSGHADQELITQCVGVAHQFISKPCEPEYLKNMIQNACYLSNKLVSDEVKKIVSSVESLPTIPTLYNQFISALNNENTSIQELGKIIQQDMGMTAQMLKLVNSAFFGLRRTIETPQEALAYLGVETIKSLVLVNGIFSETAKLKTNSCSLDDLWQHSIGVGNCAKAIAKSECASSTIQEEAFVGGLLHDVGILLLAANFPEAYDRAIADSMQSGTPLPASELHEFNVTHAEVGAYLLGLWGIPAPILGIVSMHHQPEYSELTGFNPLLAVHVADVLSAQEQHHRLFESAQIDELWLAKSGLESHINEWRTLAIQPSEP